MANYFGKHKTEMHRGSDIGVMDVAASVYGKTSILEVVDTFNRFEGDTYFVVFNPFKLRFDGINWDKDQIEVATKEEARSVVRAIVSEATERWLDEILGAE